MLTPEAAKEALKRFKVKGWAKRRLAAIDKLPAAEREAARLFAGIDRRGRRIDWYARHDRHPKAVKHLESISDRNRLRVFKALFPGLAQHVHAAWELTKRLPYQTGYMRRAFRAPNTPSLTADRRAGWLTGLADTVGEYEPDAVWLATWGGYLDDYSAPMAIGVLLAAAIDEGGKVGEEVRGVLEASANGEHEIGRMGRHIVRAFLACSRPDCWEFMERLLLAAQRQEGLRQSILEAVDESHPDAFRRMLRLILENNLARFSSVVRAFDVWFGFLEGATNARVVNDNIARILKFLDEPKARSAALRKGGGDDVYVALWTLGFEDAVAAVKPAAKLLKDKDVERRGAAVYFLRQANLATGYLELVGMVEDKDPRIAACAVETFTGWMGLHESIRESDLFERLELLAERVPKKGKEQEPLIWPWHTHTLDQRLVSLALHRARGKRSPARLAPYVKMMEPGVRGLVAQDLAGMKRLPPDARKTLFALAGDASPSVREHALKAISKLKAGPEEMRGIEALLTRKAADLRRGVLSILLNQKNPGALASADRLLGAKTAPERLAGLEVLRQMVEAGRSREDCRGRAREYKETRSKVADAEKKQLDIILDVKREAETLDDCLGLIDPADRTGPELPRRLGVKHTTRAASELLKSLDALVHKHRAESYKYKWSYGGEEEVLLGEAGWRFPGPNPDAPRDEEIARLPLREVWASWWDGRPKKLRDPDGFEVLRAKALLACGTRGYGERKTSWLKELLASVFDLRTLERMKYASIASEILDWQLMLHPPGGAPGLLLDAMEDSFALMPVERIVRLRQLAEKETRGYYRDYSDYLTPYEVWFKVVDTHKRLAPNAWNDEHHVRLWRLMRWRDEPVVRAGAAKRLLRKLLAKGSGEDLVPIPGPRQRPGLEVVLAAYGAGGANRADVIDQLLGPRPKPEDYSPSGLHDDLHTLTGRKRPKEFAECPGLEGIVDECRARILEVEFARGDTPTAASDAATSLRSVRGADAALGALVALGKAKFVRGYSWGAKALSKPAVLSNIVRISLPSKSDTPESFARKAKAADIPEKRLVEFALYAPQWVSFVEHALGWKGMKDTVWWIHAHTKDTHWDVDSEIRELWAAEASERTPLSSKDLLDGAVDVEWYQRARKAVSEKQWSMLLDAARYASSSGGHKRAELFARAMAGQVEKKELVERITEKRHQDAARALGLLPLGRGKAREKDVLGRYEVMQEFLRTSRKFGAQRRESEKRAVTIGTANLARTAGYADPMRFQWAMEAHAVADLADGPLTVEAEGAKVELSVDSAGGVELTVTKGGKRLKSVPAKARKVEAVKALRKRKTELSRQTKRIRRSLEETMCRGDEFKGAEITELMKHPLLAPMLSNLVLIGEGITGYPVHGGKALVDCEENVEPVKKKERVRIAHALDLLETGKWHLWQRDCFGRERIQPFKQVFRELYPLTDAERKQGGELSRRYAGHQVQPRQALALLGGRGWVHHPEEGVRRTFHELDISAWLVLQETFWTPAEIEGLTLEGVQFTKRADWKPLKLEDIPPRAFSEVMRDVDLVVSVAHMGGVDPEASASTVEMRSALLRETCSLLKLGNVEVKDRRALVKGKLGEYSVHLGSAVTHRMPGGALFIVPVHSQHRGRFFLPFADDDPRTAEVVSKVLLLARDDEIKDPNILDQIGRST